MEIKEAIEVLEKFNDTIFTNTPEMVEAVDIVLSLLSQIQDAEMPKKLEPEKEIGEVNWDYCKGFNNCHDLWFAYHLKKVGEILELSKKIKNWNCDNVNCGRGAICNFCALRKNIEAIAKEMGKE